MTKTFCINEKFKDIAENISIPMFEKKINTNSLFSNDGEMILLEKTMLSEGFDLDKADRNVDFTTTNVKAVEIDLEEKKKDEFVPVHKNLNQNQLDGLRRHIQSLPTESMRTLLASSIAEKIQYNEIPNKKVVDYVKSLIKDFNSEVLSDLYNNEWNAVNAIKTKINSLLTTHREKKFNDLIDIEQITCSHEYHFPAQITPSRVSSGLQKGLYEEEADMDNFEYEVIRDVASLDNVVFWHRNIERQGFCINGFINHYPDFIVYLRSGKVILIETKGNQLDGSDSKAKIQLGEKWEKYAGTNYRYYMVFKDLTITGALTVKELLERLKGL